ncbi:MAG: DNA internalization-related competence protein ComEC/Rec2 [Lachnospiraceae bacterium]
MSKRPLCILAFLLFLILLQIPEEVWLEKPAIPSGTPVSLSGTVKRREEKGEKQIYYLKNCFVNETESVSNVLVYEESEYAYPVGSKITLYGKIYQLNQATNPGEFDSNFYYQCRNIVYTFQTECGATEAVGKNHLMEWLTSIKLQFKRRLQTCFPERDAGILSAVFLGDKSLLDKEEQLLYQQNGISHLLAISGLHISMIGMAVYRSLRKIGAAFLEAGIPCSLFLILYGAMTGFGVSAVRAICMFLVMILADILGRTYDMASAMALAAILILLQNPLQARNAAFLFSFGALAGICIVYPVMKKLFTPKNPLIQSILFSISLNLVTWPITVHFYYEYPLYSILLNLIVIPLMPIVMISGGAGLAGTFLHPKAAAILELPCRSVLLCYEFLGTQALRLPGSRVILGQEQPWQLLCYYVLLILFLLIGWYGRRRIITAVLPAAVLIISLRIRTGLFFTMLDVGQGDALFLRMPSGTTFLIDGGSTSQKNVGVYKILPYLKYEGVSRLDYIVFTHLDSDHTNGAKELIEKVHDADGISVGQVLFPAIGNPDDKYRELLALCKAQDISARTIGAGDRLEESEVLMECLWPVRDSRETDKNNASVVLQITYRKFSMLLTGDLGAAGESSLLQRNCPEDTDVWKVSHHGSDNAGSEAFLRTISPELSLISVSEKNSYGHPGEKLLLRLKNIESIIKATDEEGAILLHTDGISCCVDSGRKSCRF